MPAMHWAKNEQNEYGPCPHGAQTNKDGNKYTRAITTLASLVGLENPPIKASSLESFRVSHKHLET